MSANDRTEALTNCQERCGDYGPLDTFSCRFTAFPAIVSLLEQRGGVCSRTSRAVGIKAITLGQCRTAADNDHQENEGERVSNRVKARGLHFDSIVLISDGVGM